MLITNVHEIGERLLLIRKKAGLTQSETAERAGLSDRTYADVTPVEPPSESTGETDETASSDTPPDESSETP